MNEQVLVSVYTPEMGASQIILFQRELEKAIGGKIDRVVCLARPEHRERAERELRDLPGKAGGLACEMLEAALSPDMVHSIGWDILQATLVPYLERNKGDTFHVDAAVENPVLHSVLVMLQYAGRLPQPTNLWVRGTGPGGPVRYRVLKLPVESLDLRLRKSSGPFVQARYDRERIVSEPLRRALDTIFTASRIPAIPILLLGEKGTGKTRLVEGLLGGVKGKPVHTILCGSLQPELAMSTLFGHVRGAFTGADRDTPGLIGESSGGVLFFDEVQDLPRTVQRMLVRFLQDPEHVYRPVGSSGRELKADVDLVFASHKTEEELSLLLDPDLHDRISLVTVEIPPLRELRDDLPELWRQVWQEHVRLEGLALDPGHPGLGDFFRTYPFPGNLRDLISLALWIQILYLQSKDIEDALAGAVRRFRAKLSPAGTTDESPSPKPWEERQRPLRARIHEFRKAAVREAVGIHGSYAAAARALQVDEKTIRNALESEQNPGNGAETG